MNVASAKAHKLLMVHFVRTATVVVVGLVVAGCHGDGNDAVDAVIIDAVPIDACSMTSWTIGLAGQTISDVVAIDTADGPVFVYRTDSSLWATATTQAGVVRTAPTMVAPGFLSLSDIARNGDRHGLVYSNGSTTWFQPLTTAGVVAGAAVVQTVPPNYSATAVDAMIVPGPGLGFRFVWAGNDFHDPRMVDINSWVTVVPIDRDGIDAGGAIQSHVDGEIGAPHRGVVARADGSIDLSVKYHRGESGCPVCADLATVHINIDGTVTLDRIPVDGTRATGDLPWLTRDSATTYQAWTQRPAPGQRLEGRIGRLPVNAVLVSFVDQRFTQIVATGLGTGIVVGVKAITGAYAQRYNDGPTFELGALCGFDLTSIVATLTVGSQVMVVSSDGAVRLLTPPS